MSDNRFIPDIRPDIAIDKDGVWSYRGTEMFRKDIVQLLYRHLKQDEDERYLVDTPYVVQSVTCIFMDGKGKDVIRLHMPDDSIDELDPSTLRIGADNALYGIMAGLGFEARFSRSSYYQLAKDIEFDAGQDKFYICLNSHRYYIR
jgi:hypothetical protein